MNSLVKASLILTGLVGLLSVIVQISGLNSNFMAGQLVFLVGAIAINVGVVIWALGKTAETAGYVGQLANAAGLGLLAGLLITLTSWALLTFVFPDSIDEMRAGAVAYMDSAGMPEAEYEKQMKVLDAATPMSNAVQGGIGTFVTTFVTGAVLAIFRRRK